MDADLRGWRVGQKLDLKSFGTSTMDKINWGRVVLCGLGAALAWSALSLPILVVFGRALIEAAPPGPLLGGDRAAAGFALNAVAGI